MKRNCNDHTPLTRREHYRSSGLLTQNNNCISADLPRFLFQKQDRVVLVTSLEPKPNFAQLYVRTIGGLSAKNLNFSRRGVCCFGVSGETCRWSWSACDQEYQNYGEDNKALHGLLFPFSTTNYRAGTSISIVLLAKSLPLTASASKAPLLCNHNSPIWAHGTRQSTCAH